MGSKSLVRLIAGVYFALAAIGFTVHNAAAQSDKKIPGMSLGKFKVSNTGAATHTIPLIVPPGISGIMPKLSLGYNSQNGNGLLGIGWSLHGLPKITRCPQTLAQDGFNGGVNLDVNDRFCFEGERLIAINGTYGADGTEYRTERDSFVRIFSYGQVPAPGSGPLYFLVKNKAGESLEFGGNAAVVEGRIEAQGKTT